MLEWATESELFGSAAKRPKLIAMHEKRSAWLIPEGERPVSPTRK